MLYRIAPSSLDCPLRHAASRHAGGMKALSRRLSGATPPETSRTRAASQRDARLQWAFRSEFGSFAGIPSGCGYFGAYSGGIAGAQPPANRLDACGIGPDILADSGFLFGPGSSDQTHSVDEYVELDQVAQANVFCREFILSFS